MNRNIIILSCICGLVVIGLVALIIRATGGAAPSASLQNDVPEKYTYKDMMDQGEQGFRTEERKPAFADTGTANSVMNITQPRPESDNSTSPEEEPDAAEAQEALAAIRATKALLKQGQQTPPDDAAAEDERIRSIVAAHQPPSASPSPVTGPVGSAQQPPGGQPASFNSLQFGGGDSAPVGGASMVTEVKAVILNSAEVVTGAVVRIMLLESGQVGSVSLPRQQMVSGAVRVEETRVMIRVPGASLNGRLADLAFTAYGTDGIEGLRISQEAGAAAKEAAKEEINRNIDQATGGGVLGGVVRVVRTLGTSGRSQELVKIPAGTKIILKIEPK